MIIDIYEDKLRTEGCGCCGITLYLEDEGWGDTTLVTKAELQEHITEMEEMVERLKEILETLAE